MIPDILSKLVDLRNNGYFGNFNGNGALKSVCLSDIKRARHSRDQILVLREDLVQKSGWWVEGAAKIFKEKTSAIRTIEFLFCCFLTGGLNSLRVIPDFMGTMVQDFLRNI
jgi:hypothetical protein